MVTKEYLLGKGFVRDTGAPSSVEDFYIKGESHNFYVSVRFKEGTAVGLYAYSENQHQNIRKVVLSDTTVTKEDLQRAVQLCRFSL